MRAVPSIIHGISTTAAGTLGSAELSIQQAITATANGKDRQTLLLTIDQRILPSIQLSDSVQTNPAKHVPTTTKIPK